MKKRYNTAPLFSIDEDEKYVWEDVKMIYEPEAIGITWKSRPAYRLISYPYGSDALLKDLKSWKLNPEPYNREKERIKAAKEKYNF